MKKQNLFSRVVVIVLIVVSFFIGKFTTVNNYQSKALTAYENKAICDTLSFRLQQSDKRYQATMDALEQSGKTGKPILFTGKDKKVYNVTLSLKR